MALNPELLKAFADVDAKAATLTERELFAKFIRMPIGRRANFSIVPFQRVKTDRDIAVIFTVAEMIGDAVTGPPISVLELAETIVDWVQEDMEEREAE